MVYFLLLSSRCRLTLYGGNDSSELTTLWSRYLMLLVGFSEKKIAERLVWWGYLTTTFYGEVISSDGVSFA
jgi:hypothetical protein